MNTETDMAVSTTADGEVLILQMVQQLKVLRDIIRRKNAKIAELEQKLKEMEQHKTTIVKRRSMF